MTVPRTLVIAIILPPFFGQTSVGETIPAEPVEIGTAPQFIFDQYVIDNHWAIKYKTETMRRVFHQPEKYEHNPIIADEGGCVCVLKDENDGQWRMWYQTWVASPVEGESGRHAIAYAESEDGISWTLPKLGLHEWKESKDNNIVWTGLDGKRGSQVFLLDLPEADRREYRYLMLYGGVGGSQLIGSQDGIHWDVESATVVTRMHSDTHNAHEGELRVRVSDERRKVLPGFDYADCETFHGDDVAHQASWKEASIESLKGKVIRLEIFLKNADIYTFRATGDSGEQ